MSGSVSRLGPDGGQAIRATLPTVAARLPEVLPRQRWFAGKEQAVTRVEIRDTATLPDLPSTLLAIVDVFSGPGAPAAYFLPLIATDARAGDHPAAEIARVGDLIVRDAVGDTATCRVLLRGIADGRTLPTDRGGRFRFQPAPRHAERGGSPLGRIDPDTIAIRSAGVEQSNSSIILGDTLILKAFRRLSSGVNPEIEVLRFLGAHTTFDRVPALLGWAEYEAPDGVSTPVGVLQAFVPNQGDGWAYVLRTVARAGRPGQAARQEPRSSPDSLRATLTSDLADLGRTLAGLHLALASSTDDPDFTPEPIEDTDLAAWRERTHASLGAALARIERGVQDAGDGRGWPPEDRRAGTAVLAGADMLRASIDGIGVLADEGLVKTRHHGDFHLGQTLVAADGWYIIDFEGEPLRSPAERRAKQTPLRDVAGLLRSLDYARATASRQRAAQAVGPAEPLDVQVAAASEASTGTDAALAELFWQTRQAFLAAYVETVRTGGAPLLPTRPEGLERALLALEVEKALYELAYELGNRPDWVAIPLAALARFAEGGTASVG